MGKIEVVRGSIRTRGANMYTVRQLERKVADLEQYVKELESRVKKLELVKTVEETTPKPRKPRPKKEE